METPVGAFFDTKKRCLSIVSSARLLFAAEQITQFVSDAVHVQISW